LSIKVVQTATTAEGRSITYLLELQEILTIQTQWHIGWDWSWWRTCAASTPTTNNHISYCT